MSLSDYKKDQYLNPNWGEEGHVHNWRNYISEELQSFWGTFTANQKIAIARNAEGQADNEEWD